MSLITNFNKFILNEGIYDHTTGTIVDDLWKIIKFSKASYDLDNSDNVVAYNIDYRVVPKLDFVLQFIIERTSLDGSFQLDANIDDQGEDIKILLRLDPDAEPSIYIQLNPKLHDVVRHELEHATQKFGKNYKHGKELPTSPEIRYVIQTTPDRIWEYFILDDEIPAMVRGMYKQAKVEKKPIDVIFNTYLDAFIISNDITNEQKSKILEIWIKYVNDNLPSAIFKHS